MKHTLNLAMSFVLCAPIAASRADVEQLIARADPEVQSQIKKTYDSIHRLSVVSYSNVEVFQEAQKVTQLVADDEVRLADEVEIVRQLAIFVATTESVENSHVIISWTIWRYLNVSPDATTRALAPYLDASNVPLRGFARDWFEGHDDYEDFKKYVRWKASRQEEAPAPFIKLLFERSPGQALRVMQSGSVDVRAQLEVFRGQIEAAQQGLEPTTPEQEQKEKRDAQKRREILLAEHIVSSAIWLHKNGFDQRFQAALPEAMAELEKLASHKQWWARLYVVYIMRQNHVLLQDHILRQLSEDENELVREAATAGRAQ